MKKIAQLLGKIGPAITLCLAAVLALNANTATCFFFNQPEAPKALDKFKRFK
jgi:cyclic lactone autoinducer peptide